MMKIKIFIILFVEIVAGIQKGEFPDNESLKCYTLCIMKAMRTVTKKAFLLFVHHELYRTIEYN
jgi:hypothetical protein